MGIAKIYGKRFKDDFKYYFTHWLPNGPIEVGTVGELVDGYLFRPLSSLKDRGVDFEPTRDVLLDTSPSPMKFVSSSGYQMTTKLAGDVNTNLPNIPKGSAGIKVAFKEEGVFVIEARQSYEHRLKDVPAIERQILELYRAKKWEKRFVVVLAAVAAPYADILVSETKSSEIELELAASGNAGRVELGNAELQFHVASTSGRMLDMRGSQNIVPAVQLLGLKRKWYGAVKPGTLRGLNSISEALLENDLGSPGELNPDEYGLSVLGTE